MADIKFLLGTSDYNMSRTTKKEGTVYFLKDSTSKTARVYLDASGTERYNVVPEIVDCGSWDVFDLGMKDPNCCFVAGSLVLYADNTTKEIEQVTKGDIVMSYNIFTEEFYPVVVQKLIVNNNTVDMALVVLDNGVTLEMNAYHPIYTKNGFHSLTNHNGYDTLIIGDEVKCFDGYHIITDIIRKQLPSPIVTYNLATKNIDETIDDDTYDTFIVNNCVVHNATCPV